MRYRELPRSGRRPRLTVLVAALALLCRIVIAGQTDQGRITGTVRDETRALVAGATVAVKNERTGEERIVAASEQGYYVVTALRPSSYTVKVSATGFASAQVSQVHLAVGQELTIDVELKAAGVAETVTIVGGQDAVIDASSARIGVNVNQREVEGLPINGRQLSQLYLQAPGSQNTGSGTFGDIRFTGRAVEQNVIRYDGVEGTAIIDTSPGNFNGEVASPFRLQTSLENVQEFRVESNNYPAEYGTGTGGQISVISKSGSNQFHGSAFEFLRNSSLDARNFFDLGGKSPLRLNQFGGSVGGPVVKDKLFFFVSYEGYRLRSGINAVEAVPSNSARARAVPSIRPLLDSFVGPGAVILLGRSASPDFEIAQLNSSVRVNENAMGLRLDYRFSDKQSLYARFYRDHGENDQPEGVTGRRVALDAVPQNAVLAWLASVTPNTINEFKLGYNGARTRINGLAPVVNGIDLSPLTINISGSVANFGIAGQGSSSGIAIPGGLVRQNSATNGRGAPYTPYSISFLDSLSWVRGTHNAKFGGELRLVRMYTDRLGGTTYTWSNLNDFLANRSATVSFVGDLSDPSPFNNGATGQRRPEAQYYIGYAQDEWKLRPNLTLNYGLRYEYYTPLREKNDLQVLFDTRTGQLRDPREAAFKSNKAAFGPRIAITWSPNQSGAGFFAGGKTVFRGGFGIYYGPGQTEDQIQPIESDVIRTSLSNQVFPVPVAALRDNFLNNPLNRRYQPRAYASEYKIPERIYQYTVSWQQELFHDIVATVAYVGSQGRNLFLRSVTNKIVSVRPDGTAIREFDIVRPDGSIQRPFAEIDYKTSGGHDSYNALQTSLIRRFNTGLTLAAQYTLGRSFGTSAGSNEAQTSGCLDDFECDNGYNRFDVRHTFNLSALYGLPFGKGRRYLSQFGGIGEALLGNWEIGTIINARSGSPVDLLVVRNDVVFNCGGKFFNAAQPGQACAAVINTPGGGASRNVRRPDLIPGVNPYLKNDRQWLNPAAFSIPAPGTFGNLQRGLIRGPNFKQFDLIVNKRFRITETANVEFRTEIFNVPNVANFANPSGTLNNALGVGTNLLQPGEPFSQAAAGSTFGLLRSTVERTVGLGTNRQIQFALRFNF